MMAVTSELPTYEPLSLSEMDQLAEGVVVGVAALRGVVRRISARHAETDGGVAGSCTGTAQMTGGTMAKARRSINDDDGGNRRFGESVLHRVRSCTVHCWRRWQESH